MECMDYVFFGQCAIHVLLKNAISQKQMMKNRHTQKLENQNCMKSAASQSVIPPGTAKNYKKIYLSNKNAGG